MTAAGPPAPAPPRLSIVVGAHVAEAGGAACLAALADQRRPGVEVILVEDGPGGPAAPDWMVRVRRPGGLVPELWAEGLRHASGDLIALTAATVVPDGDWVDRILGADAGGPAAVGGPVEPGVGLGLVDWAVYFCRYAPYMLPIAEEEHLEVAADNASYRGEVLRRYRHLYEDGFWEPFVHHAMRRDGHLFRVGTDRVVRQAPGASAARFCRQRYLHGRANGCQRSIGLGRRHILQGILTTPLVPAVMTARAGRLVRAKGRLMSRFVASAPIVLLFYTAWATGEMAGRLSSLVSPRTA